MKCTRKASNKRYTCYRHRQSYFVIISIQNRTRFLFGACDIFLTPWAWTAAVFVFHQQMGALNLARVLGRITIGLGGREWQFPLRLFCINVEIVTHTCRKKPKKQKNILELWYRLLINWYCDLMLFSTWCCNMHHVTLWNAFLQSNSFPTTTNPLLPLDYSINKSIASWSMRGKREITLWEILISCNCLYRCCGLYVSPILSVRFPLLNRPFSSTFSQRRQLPQTISNFNINVLGDSE